MPIRRKLTLRAPRSRTKSGRKRLRIWTAAFPSRGPPPRPRREAVRRRQLELGRLERLRHGADQRDDHQPRYLVEPVRGEQQRLNRLYDSFTEKYGLINSRANSLAFADDSSYYLLCSLEVLDEQGELARKADMFTRRTIKQNSVITSVDTAMEALALSISEKAGVDMTNSTPLTVTFQKFADCLEKLETLTK